MEITYKGHKAKLQTKTTAMSVFGPNYGDIKLDSTICSYYLKGIAMNEKADVIGNIFIKWFKNKVDENLDGL